MMNTMDKAVIETERLILRRFGKEDLEALFLMLRDEEVNRFLPWYPVRTIDEARAFYEERLMGSQSYACAICLKEENVPVGYLNASSEEPYDLGYGLRKEFWHRGITTEACKALIRKLRKDGMPYITATHDRNNPRSGGVMRNIGMRYCYSYEEQWQPKDIPVVFRMYQMNLNAADAPVYMGYWNRSGNHFVEML